MRAHQINRDETIVDRAVASEACRPCLPACTLLCFRNNNLCARRTTSDERHDGFRPGMARSAGTLANLIEPAREGLTPARDSYGYRQQQTGMGMDQAADRQLAKRVIEGDQASFDAFFSLYYPRLYRFALARLGRDRSLADETAQNVLCQALSKLDTYRGEAPLFSWLCTFCRHEVSKQLKARRRAQGDTPMTEDDPAVRAALDSLLAASASDPDVERYQAELGSLVQTAMDHLPSLYADVLEAKYVRDLSVNEIAALVGKTPKATESVLTRARAAFRDCFRTLADLPASANDGRGRLSSILD